MKLVYLYSAIKMMRGPINFRFVRSISSNFYRPNWHCCRKNIVMIRECKITGIILTFPANISSSLFDPRAKNVITTVVNINLSLVQTYGNRGRTVVMVLCYKSEGRWFDPSCQWIFY